MSKSDIDDIDLLANNSQIMKLGHAALKKSISGVQSQQKVSSSRSTDETKSSDVKLPFALVVSNCYTYIHTINLFCFKI